MAEPILITPPTVEPLTLSEAKLHLRVEHSDDDALISALIVAVREMAEVRLGRRLITQTWDMVLDAFPASGQAIRLQGEVVKAQAITQIVYLNGAGQSTTLLASTYALDQHSLPGYVFPTVGNDWPTDVSDSANAVRVRVRCGFGDNAASVPPGIVAWIKAYLGGYYENREAVAQSRVFYENPYLDRLLDGYVVHGR